MTLDRYNLGRLRQVASAREVWTSESGDFTPWLAENLDVLADELGIALTLVATEVPVGAFRLDIQAETADGRLVVIENQLERTDHNHLGQLLAYAAGLEAAAVVWVAPHFREDHRLTLDWLNDRTDGVGFFAVEIRVMQISDGGPRAPVFEVVSRPNDFQTDVKEAAGSSGAATISPLNAARQDWYAEVLTEVVAQRAAIRMPARGTGNWLQFASGVWGYWALSAASEGRMRVEAYIDCGDQARNKQLFDELEAEASDWERSAGVQLSWERLDDKRASRIATYHQDTVDLKTPSARVGLTGWATHAIQGMFDTLNEPLRARAIELRDLAKDREGSDPAASPTGVEQVGPPSVTGGEVVSPTLADPDSSSTL